MDEGSVGSHRLDQLRRTSSWTSGLSVPELAAVRSAGFDPVGQVLGTTVEQIGYSGAGGCGFRPALDLAGYTASGMPVRRLPVAGTQGGQSRWVGYPGRVDALKTARRRAVGRLEQECRALGGDGVVGVRLRIQPFPAAPQAIEFSVTGTAVRAQGRYHPPRPFLSDLSGQDVAALLHRGWVPCGLVFGIAIGVRHDDYATRNMTLRWANGEIPGYTALVQGVRAEVRRQIEADVRRQGGTGLVVRDMTLKIDEQECRTYEGRRDHRAEATLTGTALVPFRSGGSRPAAGTLRIMRLDQRHNRVLADHLTDREREFH